MKFARPFFSEHRKLKSKIVSSSLNNNSIQKFLISKNQSKCLSHLIYLNQRLAISCELECVFKHPVIFLQRSPLPDDWVALASNAPLLFRLIYIFL